MRFKYYKITLRQMRFNRAFVFFLILTISISITIFVFNNRVSPIIISLSENYSKQIALRCTNEAVLDSIANVTYTSLINLEKDSKGKITSLSANTMEINRLSNKIATDVQDKIINTGESYITLPIFSLFGSSLVGGYGPDIKVKTIPEGNVEVKFRSNFDSVGINQTRHRIYLEVVTHVMIIVPFHTSYQEYCTEILVAETIIVSDIPSTYFNTSGIFGTGQ